MVSINKNANVVNVVVAFDVAGSSKQTAKQAEDMLQLFAKHKGFIAATLLESPDAEKTVSILQWETLADHSACMNHPTWRQGNFPKPKTLLEPLPYRILAEVNSVQTAVAGYTEGWMSGNLEAARAYLAPNVKFQDPVNRFSSADELVQALGGFLQIYRGSTMIGRTCSEDSATIVYDCKVATPVGSLRCAEHFKVASGKITDITLVFDATELNKLKGN